MDNQKTLVTVTQTTITMYNELNADVTHEKIAGNLNITECKEYARNKGLIYVNRKTEKETFNVSTIRLLLLKED